MKNNNFEKIPQEKFAFVQMGAQLHDSKLETKSRSFFADAMIRFSKNKSSVVAAWILLFLVLFSLFGPMLTPTASTRRIPFTSIIPPMFPPLRKRAGAFWTAARFTAARTTFP